MAALGTLSLLKFTLLACTTLVLGLAAPASAPIIGVVITSAPGGEIQVDGVGAVGNASLIQGAHVQTGDGPAQIRLFNGARATLQEGSQARVFADHILVETGAAKVSTKGYKVEMPESTAGRPVTPSGKFNLGGSASQNATSKLPAATTKVSGPPVSSFASSGGWSQSKNEHGDQGDKGGGDGHGGHGHNGDHDGDHGHDGDHDHHHHHKPPVSRP